MQGALLLKHNIAFWKTWKNKVSNKTGPKIRLQDNPSPN